MYSRSQRLFKLAAIEKHVGEGSTRIAKMQRLIAEGERQRFDVADAKFLLTELLTTQAQREAHRDRVLRELDHSPD